MNNLQPVNPQKNGVSKLLISSEFGVIAGFRWNKLYILGAIFLLTMIAIGFAVKSVSKLETSMKDPFTMWIDVVLDSRTRDSLGSLVDRYTEEDARERYNLKNLKPYALDWWNVIGADGRTYQRRGRQIDINGALLKEILKGSTNADTLTHFFGECGLILEADLLHALGYTDIEKVRSIEVEILGRRIFVNVVAIVHQLPNQADFIIATNFYNLRNTTDYESDMFPPNSNIQFVHSLYRESELIRDSLSVIFAELRSESTLVELADSIYNAFGAKRYIHKIRFPLSSDVPPLDTFIAKTNGLYRGRIEGYINWNCGRPSGSDKLYSPDWLSFNFSQLENVGVLREDLKSNYGIEIGMGKVKSAENFGRVSRMTFIMAGLLWLFGVLSAILFINNQFKTHLERSKANLGTLKAFGMSNKLLRTIYIKILSRFLLLSASMAYGLSIIAQVVDEVLFGSINGHIDVLNVYVFLSIFGVISMTLIVTSRTIRSILGGTPGDLIYSR